MFIGGFAMACSALASWLRPNEKYSAFLFAFAVSADPGGWKVISRSALSKRISAPVLIWMEEIKKMAYNPLKDKIFVAIGDPTIEKRMVSDEAVTALKKAVDNHTFDGYNSPFGIMGARQALAKLYSEQGITVDHSDVIMGSGGSDALKLILTSLADEGDNVLLSKPDFDYYKNMVLNPHKIEYREYLIDLDKREINLSSVEEQINSRTKAILLTNPHNPTGISFSKKNLEGLLAIAEKLKLPIISDEIYQKVVYNAPFYPLAQLNPKVPIVVCDGLSKRVHVPGWRLGWSVIYDRYGALKEVKKGMLALSYEILGPSALVQGALPDILKNTPQSYYDNIKHKIKANVDMVYDRLKVVHGLNPYKPDGAMYMLIRVDEKVTGINDTQFCRNLIKEQSLYLLPGVFLVLLVMFACLYLALITRLKRLSTDLLNT